MYKNEYHIYKIITNVVTMTVLLVLMILFYILTKHMASRLILLNWLNLSRLTVLYLP